MHAAQFSRELMIRMNGQALARPSIIQDLVQVLVRSGLCLSCSGEWSLIENRIRCDTKEMVLNKCPRTTCKYYSRLALGRQPPETVMVFTPGPAADPVQVPVHQDSIEPVRLAGQRPGHPNGPDAFLEIGDIDKWVNERNAINALSEGRSG